MSEAGTGAPERRLESDREEPPPSLSSDRERSLQPAPGAVASDPPKKIGPLKSAGALLAFALRTLFWILVLGFICTALQASSVGIQLSLSQSISSALSSSPRLAQLLAALVFWLGQHLLCFGLLGLAGLLLDLPVIAGVGAGIFAGLLRIFLMLLNARDPAESDRITWKLLALLIVNAAISGAAGGYAVRLARRFKTRKSGERAIG